MNGELLEEDACLERFKLRRAGRSLQSYWTPQSACSKISSTADKIKVMREKARLPLNGQQALIPSPTKESPSSYHQSKIQLKERALRFPCRYLICQRKMVESHYFLRRQHHKRDEHGYLFTWRHFRALFIFYSGRKLLFPL